MSSPSPRRTTIASISNIPSPSKSRTHPSGRASSWVSDTTTTSSSSSSSPRPRTASPLTLPLPPSSPIDKPPPSTSTSIPSSPSTTSFLPTPRGSLPIRPSSAPPTPTSPLTPVPFNTGVSLLVPTTSPSPSSSSFTSTPPTSLNSSSATSSPYQENIHVAVRVKPMLVMEPHAGWVVEPPHQLSQLKMKKVFQVDQVYDATTSTRQVYATMVQPLVESALEEGIHGTVFTYGQTNSGKTYTMMGGGGGGSSLKNDGLLPLAMQEVFQRIGHMKISKSFLLRVAYFEIYNETFKDLLQPEKVNLTIREDAERGVYIVPLKEEIVSGYEQVMKIIEFGEANRHFSTTDYNEHSSRSHTVFQLIIESKPNSPDASSSNSAGGGGGSFSYLNLIDLAGSEKANTQAERRKEGAYINRSLLTLGTVISKLAEDKNSYIPYRDSKLTRVLQPSLSGNARISVICTLSSSLHHLDESLSTLQFATRVKRIVVQPQPKSLSEHGLLQKYKEEIEQLKSKVIEMNHHFEKERELEERTRALEKEKFTEVISQHQMIRNTLKQRIDHLSRLILLSGQNNVELPPTPPTSPSSDNPAIPFDPTPTVQHLQQTILHQHQKLKELEIVIKDLEDQKEQLKKNHLEELQGWKDQVLSSTSPRPSTSTSLHEDKSTSISSDFPLLFQDTDPMNMVQPLTFHSHEVQTDGSGVEDPVIPPFVQETHPIIDPMPSLPVRLNMTESKDAWTAMSIEEIPLTSSKSTQVMEEPPLTQEEKETHPSESTPPSVPSFSTPSTQEDLNSTFVKDLNITTATLALPLSQESNLRSSSNEPSSSVEMTLDECKTQLTLLQQRLDEERTEQVSIVEALQKQIQWMHEDTKYWKNMADACTLQVEHMDEQMLTQATLHQGTYQQLETIQTQLKHLIHQNKALQSQYQEQMESLQTELDLTRMEVNLLNLMRSTPTFHFYKPVKDPLDPLDGK